MIEKRIEEVDVLRGIAAVLMILGHSFIKYPVDISNVPWCSFIGHFIYTFHMELFFLLAGVVYKCTNYKTFMARKFQRILVPYIFFGIATLMLKAFGGSAINGVESLGTGIYKFLFKGGNYWFLYVLFILFTVYPLVERGLNTKYKKAILIIILLGIQCIVEIPEFLALGALVKHITYFVLGHCIADVLVKKEFQSKKIKWISIICALLVFIGLDMLEIMDVYELQAVLRFVRASAIMLILYYGASFLLEISVKSKLVNIIKNFLEECSKYSLQLYLFNGFLLTALRIIVCQILNIETPIVIVLSIWTGNIVITLVACRWIMPHIPIIKKLCGI